MTKEEMKANITQAHIDGYNRGYAKAKDKIADIKANCDLAIEGRDVKIMELETENNKLLDVINNQDVKIADLEKQIEKMKCCENCKYNSYWGDELHCNYGLKEVLQEDKLVECKNMNKWELKND